MILSVNGKMSWIVSSLAVLKRLSYLKVCCAWKQYSYDSEAKIMQMKNTNYAHIHMRKNDWVANEKIKTH